MMMSSPQKSSEQAAAKRDLKLEVVVIPVADVERAKRFYTGLGWRLDADFNLSADYWGVQVTPPNSPCSVMFGKGVTGAAPGSAQGLMLVVDDIAAARAELVSRGADVSAVFHFEGGIRATGTKGRVPGPDPQGRSYFSLASFSDPDGNGWLLQEVKTRLPGRVWPSTNTEEVVPLIELLREAEEHHGEYERVAPKHHWSSWYAAYIVARKLGRTSQEAAQDAALHLEGTRK
jgi:catechol 2,3-dioxygenase-like lactoylglutathione lyase family enzyme